MNWLVEPVELACWIAQLRRMRKKVASPTTCWSAWSVCAPRKYTGPENRLASPGAAGAICQTGSVAGIPEQ